MSLSSYYEHLLRNPGQHNNLSGQYVILKPDFKANYIDGMSIGPEFVVEHNEHYNKPVFAKILSAWSDPTDMDIHFRIALLENNQETKHLTTKLGRITHRHYLEQVNSIEEIQCWTMISRERYIDLITYKAEDEIDAEHF